jgi:DNA-directed RNA polymerase sigma subunit (sigma70/sigma32)
MNIFNSRNKAISQQKLDERNELIYSLYNNTNTTYKVLGKQFGISRERIRQIINRGDYLLSLKK